MLLLAVDNDADEVDDEEEEDDADDENDIVVMRNRDGKNGEKMKPGGHDTTV